MSWQIIHNLETEQKRLADLEGLLADLVFWLNTHPHAEFSPALAERIWELAEKTIQHGSGPR